MRALATGLLLAMAALYLATHLAPAGNAAIGFVRAFAEAAMVGALADWFAVTALFRHPMGLPIPHTAIVPRNKDRIGESLASFVERNFLSPKVLAEKLAGIDFSAAFLDWVTQPGRAREIATRVTLTLPDFLDAVEDARVQRFLREQAARIGELELQPVLDRLGQTMAAGNRVQGVLDRLIEQAGTMLSEKEAAIRAQIRDDTSWLGKRMGMDERLGDQLMAVLRQALAEIAGDAQHPMRRRFDAAVRDFVAGLGTRVAVGAAGEGDGAWLRRFLEELWQEAKDTVRRDAGSPESLIRQRLEDLLLESALRLRSEPELGRKANAWLRDLVQAAIESHRQEFSQLIVETVHKWDPATVVAKIELEVGADLQYVRINGTLIGGLVGLALHGVSVLLV